MHEYTEFETKDHKSIPWKLLHAVSYCDSLFCIGSFSAKAKLSGNGCFMRKKVTAGTIFCPDCKHALIWKMEKKEK